MAKPDHKLIAALPILASLAGCGPSQDDVARALGHEDVSNVSCAASSGKPGYVCTYTYRQYDLTARFIKRDDGRWDVIY